MGGMRCVRLPHLPMHGLVLPQSPTAMILPEVPPAEARERFVNFDVCGYVFN